MATTEQAVVLTWDAHARASSFRVEGGLSPEGPFEALGNVEAPTFVDESAPVDGQVFYRIAAEGDGCEAPAHAAHLAYGPPLAPTDVVASALSDAAATLTFSNPSITATRLVVEGQQPDGAWVRVGEVEPSATEINLGGLLPDRVYPLRVGAMVPTSIAPVFGAPSEALTHPYAVYDVTVTATGPSSVRVDFEHNNVHATHIEVRKKEAQDFFFEDFQVLAPDARSFVDDTLESWVFYRYQVRVWNASGDSEDVEFAASAWLPPRPFLDGDLVVDDSCVLDVGGSFQIDVAHGAAFASASGAASGPGAPALDVTGGFSGVTVDLAAPWTGTLDVTWSVTDTFAQTGTTTETVRLAQHDDGQVFGLAPPTAVLGGDTAAGHQLLLSPPVDDEAPCDAPCLGRRASVATGSAHTCVLDDQGGVLCAGDGSVGQLGRDNDASADTFDAVCASVGCAEPLKQGVHVVAGEAFTCALLDNGDVHCWGDGSLGQLGGAPSSAVPVLVQSGAVSLAAGAHHACALLDGGTVRCWGDNSEGQLGRGTLGTSSAPAAVCASGSEGTCVPLTGATGVAAGDFHTCGINESGGVWCWGRGAQGQLGDSSGGVGARALNPVAVRCGALPEDGPSPCTDDALGEVVSLSLAAGSTCALLENGRVRCWGAGEAGQLGDGLGATSLVPVEVRAAGAVLDGAVALVAGGDQLCAHTAVDGLWCWGDGPLANTALVATAAEHGADWLAADVSAGHGCGVTRGGRVDCRGDDAQGQRGDGAGAAPAPGCVGTSCVVIDQGARRACASLEAHLLIED